MRRNYRGTTHFAVRNGRFMPLTAANRLCLIQFRQRRSKATTENAEYRFAPNSGSLKMRIAFLKLFQRV